ncbi:class I SAM-dependent methyltransferase [Ottowia sp. GY511]|uniref:S-adenosyl-L-methionine-dependent methyltransferase n=1 Tax=Ottowia flava TaxID=2675430 RepID=A0ABW4KMX6_9BURK|nr:class I SAM-dependent methyltransferase [Ottowia sp. GY511]TXK29754.1 class I SAM-dependent methyltransferase [Ottowia sp. GY511]
MTKHTNRIAPEPTAVRVALWRARHLELDAQPPILNDAVGLQLAQPTGDWRRRPDMHAERTQPFRASIVARSRFVEDCVLQQLGRGVTQYVILGAGLDTFAQRHPEALAAGLHVFEVDQAGPQAWKRQRLEQLGLGVPAGLHLIPVDFESDAGWWGGLLNAGFDPAKPAVMASTGVSMYLTKPATCALLQQASVLVKGSFFIMSFMLPIDQADPDIRQGLLQSAKGAQAGGTPWISFFSPEEIVQMATDAGFPHARCVSATEWSTLYFQNRTDGLKPARAEELLVATT